MKKIFVLFLLLHLTACFDIKKKNSRTSNAGDPRYNGKQGFQLLLHDAKPTGNITEINISVLDVKLVPESGEIITISSEPKNFNLIQLTAENPLELANMVIPSGRYNQIRLVLSDNNTIKVDGVSYPLKTPSSQQSGVKLDGFFEITEGQFYTMSLDFKPDESIVYTPGTGYILKPVIKIVGTSLVSGPFSASGLIQDESVVVELNPDGTTRIITSYDPRLEIHGIYYYNYSTKVLAFQTTSVACSTCNGFSGIYANNFNNLLPVNITINTWNDTKISGSMTRIINDTEITAPVSFDKIDAFVLDTSTGYSNLKIVTAYPDSSYDGKFGIVTLRSATGGRSFIDIQKISGGTANFSIQINYKYLPGGVPGGQNTYVANLLITDNIASLNIDPINNYYVCGTSNMSYTEYNIKVPVSDKTLTVSTTYKPFY